MKKLIVLLFLYAGIANAVTLTVDGVSKEVSTVGIVFTTDRVTVTTSGGTVPQPEPEPEPEPEPACRNTLYQECTALNWSNQGGRQQWMLLGRKTLSFAFRTTASPLYAGDINISEMTGFENISRRLWISKEPSGLALTSTRCSQQGNSARKINWAQQANYLRCSLEPNTDYFLNVQNVYNCAPEQFCGFYLNLGTNGRP